MEIGAEAASYDGKEGPASHRRLSDDIAAEAVTMVVLSFSEEWATVLNHTKYQTIRHNFEFWRRAHQTYKSLHIWCPGPRSGKGRFLGRVPNDAWDAHPVRGKDFDTALARADGFQGLEELLSWLTKAHKMTLDQVLEHEWAVIVWRPWLCPPPIGTRWGR